MAYTWQCFIAFNCNEWAFHKHNDSIVAICRLPLLSSSSSSLPVFVVFQQWHAITTNLWRFFFLLDLFFSGYTRLFQRESRFATFTRSSMVRVYLFTSSFQKQQQQQKQQHMCRSFVTNKFTYLFLSTNCKQSLFLHL